MIELIDRNCSICSSTASEVLFAQPIGAIAGIGDVGFSQQIVICRDCGFVYATPVPCQEVLAGYYAHLSNYENRFYPNGDYPQDRKAAFDEVHELIINRLPPGFSGRALEIGCGVAYLLSLFKQKGWEVLGIDPSPTCAAISKRLYNVDCITSVYNSRLFNGLKPFDLIILSQVLEHLIAPQELVADLSGILTEEGLVYIEVPNLYHPNVDMGYYSFEHLNYFSPMSFASLMQRHGFTYDYPETYGHPIHYTWKRGAEAKIRTTNEYASAAKAVKNYQKTSQQEVARIQKRVDHILAEISPSRLALWGAGIHTSQILCFTGLSKAGLACLFDNDPRKQGLALEGIPVKGFNQPPMELKQEIDAILISSKYFENEIFEQIAYLQDYGIKVFKLYTG